MVRFIKSSDKFECMSQVGRELFGIFGEIVGSGMRGWWIWHSVCPVLTLMSSSLASTYGSLSAPTSIKGSSIPTVYRGVNGRRLPVSKLKLCRTRCKLLRPSQEISVMNANCLRVLFVCVEDGQLGRTVGGTWSRPQPLPASSA